MDIVSLFLALAFGAAALWALRARPLPQAEERPLTAASFFVVAARRTRASRPLLLQIAALWGILAAGSLLRALGAERAALVLLPFAILALGVWLVCVLRAAGVTRRTT